MAVGLDQDLMSLLIEQFGGVTKLHRAWEETYGIEEAPDSTTLRNWQGGSLPNSSIRLLRLAHLLDVDPFCLLKPHNGSTAKAIGDIFCPAPSVWATDLRFL